MKCAREACNAIGTQPHREMQASFYCRSCARRINELNGEEVVSIKWEDPFEPSDVIVAYESKGITPGLGSFGVMSVIGADGEVLAPSETMTCCALGTMMAGLHVPPTQSHRSRVSSVIASNWPILDVGAFAIGFDQDPSHGDMDMPPFNSIWWQRLGSYRLGRRCRVAVEERFGPIEMIA